MFAETMYLFRHALHRDAAYQLHLPSARATLHALALDILVDLFGVEPVSVPGSFEALRHGKSFDWDFAAADLVSHARASSPTARQPVNATFLWRAALAASSNFRLGEAIDLWRELAEHTHLGWESRTASRIAASETCFEAGRPTDAAEDAKRAVELASASVRGDSSLLAQAELTLANAIQVCSGAKAALPLFTSAMERARRLGEVKLARRCLANMSIALRNSGDLQRAEQATLEVQALCKAEGDSVGEMMSTGGLGIIYQHTSRLDLAERCFTRCLELARQLGNRRSECLSHGNISVVYTQTRRASLAVDSCSRAVGLARQLGDRRFEAQFLCNLGVALNAEHRIADSYQVTLAAVAVARETSDLGLIAVTLGNLGDAQIKSGRISEGRAHVSEALSLAQKVGDHRAQAMWLGTLAEANESLAESAAQLEKAEQLANKARDPRTEARWKYGRARAFRKLNRLADAATLVELAMELAEKSGDIELQARCMVESATIQIHAGKLMGAKRQWSAARQFVLEHALKEELVVLDPELERLLAGKADSDDSASSS